MREEALMILASGLIAVAAAWLATRQLAWLERAMDDGRFALLGIVLTCAGALAYGLVAFACFIAGVDALLGVAAMSLAAAALATLTLTTVARRLVVFTRREGS
jgi:hypothetical protein